MDSARNWAAATLVLLCLGCLSAGRTSVPGVTVEFKMRAGAENQPSIVARWPDRRPQLPPGELLAVRLPGQPPLLGVFKSTDRSVTFTPSFPLLAGLRHEAAVLPDGPSVFYTPPPPPVRRRDWPPSIPPSTRCRPITLNFTCALPSQWSRARLPVTLNCWMPMVAWCPSLFATRNCGPTIAGG